ncbi:MAG: pyridoxal phosphate-dependent aminotransferase [Candidatus Aenigmatarchaeota archaeon]
MLRNVISDREKDLPILTIGKFLKLAEEDKSVLSLGPGEPDFDAPPNVIKAAKKALDDKETHYSPVGGRQDLKEAVVKAVKKNNKIKCNPENVMITTGSTEGILLTLLCIMDPGESVIVPDPSFLSYEPTVEILSGKVIKMKLHEQDDFHPNFDRFNKKFNPEKTRAIIINTPSNPTGVVFRKKMLEEVADFAVENDLIIMSDEAYEKLIYDGVEHTSIGSFNGMEDRVVTLHSFSKSYAMPGFRVGYAIASEKLVEAMKKVHIFTSLSTPTISQIAAIEALKGPQGYVDKMVKEYDRRRKMIVKRLDEMEGVECVRPQGAFYAFPKIESFGMKSLEFSEQLLKKAKVAVLPGTEFGAGGEGFIRCSYATSYEKIEKALDKMKKFLRDF